MDASCYVILTTILYSVLFWALDPIFRRLSRLPPGPRRLPVIGSISTVLQFAMKPNDSLQTLGAMARQYGPIMSLFLGVNKLVIVSSPDIAKQILQTHDKNFAGRCTVESSKVMDYYKRSLILAQQGAHHRLLRRISATELFCPKKLMELYPLRHRQVAHTVHMVFHQSQGSFSINVRDLLLKSSLKLLGKMVFSNDMFEVDSANFIDFKDSLAKYVDRAGSPTVLDFFPVLRPLDPEGVLRDTEFYIKKVYGFIDGFIQKRLTCQHPENGNKDFLDTLMSLRSYDFTLSNIKVLISDLFAAGTDTSTITTEWAMAEMMRNREMMAKAQAELDEVVGKERIVEENDMEKLPYLRAIVKETLRLHPAAPLLIPHRAENRCEIAGFVIPKDANVIVNFWAIARDPSVWKDPLKFDPERFLNANIDFKGQSFDFIPFGSGRRMCVGLPLANAMVHSILGALIQCFTWRLPDGEKEVDMSEKFGITLHKTSPLMAEATPRLPALLYRH